MLIDSRKAATKEEQQHILQVSLWEGTEAGASFFCLNNMLYHLMSRTCEVSALLKNKTTLEPRTYGPVPHKIPAFNVERHKTNSMPQVMRVFPHRDNIEFCPHFSLAYLCVMTESPEDCFFPEFYSKLSNKDQNVQSRTADLFKLYYKKMCDVTDKYGKFYCSCTRCS